jgi:hypothetical protein
MSERTMILDKVLIVLGVCLLMMALIGVPSQLLAQDTGLAKCPNASGCNTGCHSNDASVGCAGGGCAGANCDCTCKKITTKKCSCENP